MYWRERNQSKLIFQTRFSSIYLSKNYMKPNDENLSLASACVIFMTLLVFFFLILRLVDYTLILLFSILHYMSLERIKLKT